jgi:hypothetical protein
VEIVTEAGQFLEKEYINGIFVAVHSHRRTLSEVFKHAELTLREGRQVTPAPIVFRIVVKVAGVALVPDARHNRRLQLPGVHLFPVHGLEPAVAFDVLRPVLEVSDPLGAVLDKQLLQGREERTS